MLALAAVSLLALAQVSPGGTEGAPLPAPTAPAPAEAAHGPPIPSLLSAEPLRGTSVLSAEAGWSRVSLAYAQGLGAAWDLGGFASFDYATTELRVGALYRQPLPPVRPFDSALRLSLAYYDDAGSRWLHDKNHSDHGFEIGFGGSLSKRGAGGVVSILGDLPVTVTFKRDGGLVVGPRVGVAYETPLYGRFTVGVHGAVGYRFGVGSAPFKNGLAEASLLAIGTYRVF